MRTLTALLLLFAHTAFGQGPATELRDDFRQHYDRYRVQGSFALLDPQTDRLVLCNAEQFDRPFTPASTFKIGNTLIGLETGAVADAGTVMPWDGTVRPNPAWNRDHDLQSAFRHSTVWYYQELARRIDPAQMQHWLTAADYGNADTSGGIDRFWLTGGLRISPRQQLDFLQRLHDSALPFSPRTMDITRNIMTVEDTLGHVLRAKTGWGTQDGMDIGWYVGYVETHGKVYYFANCIQTTDPDHKDFARARIDIARLILHDLGLLER